MKKAFTILELLVASLLLSMLVTILTMLFNQSSIAWRTGVAGVVDMDDVRTKIGQLRDEADNAFVWNGNMHRWVSLWDDSGNLRKRSWDASDVGGSSTPKITILPTLSNSAKLSDISSISVGSSSSGNSLKSYTVNVKSAGPDLEFNTWDDIWSFPDEIN